MPKEVSKQKGAIFYVWYLENEFENLAKYWWLTFSTDSLRYVSFRILFIIGFSGDPPHAHVRGGVVPMFWKNKCSSLWERMLFFSKNLREELFILHFEKNYLSSHFWKICCSSQCERYILFSLLEGFILFSKPFEKKINPSRNFWEENKSFQKVRREYIFHIVKKSNLSHSWEEKHFFSFLEEKHFFSFLEELFIFTKKFLERKHFFQNIGTPLAHVRGGVLPENPMMN